MSSNPLDHSSKSNNSSRSTLERRLDIVVTQGTANATGSFLLVVSGEQSGKLFPLNKPKLIIGRSPNADVRVNEKAVSHKHAGISVDGQHYTIRDLGSTNGTLVNGNLATDAVELQGGDTIAIGSTTLTFLSREDQGIDRTIQLQGGSRPAPGMEYIEAMRSQPSMPPAMAPGMAPSQYAAAYPVSMVPPGEESMSFTDVLRKINTFWLYTKRYGWLVATCTCFGVAAGILQTRLSPPPGSAWFEVILSSRGVNSDDDDGRSGVPIFLSPDSTFRSLPLIKKTWKELTNKVPSDDFASALQKDLTFEQAGYKSPLWRGEYRSGTSARAVEFLTKHLHVYLENEVDKKLNLIRSPLKVIRRQLDEAQTTMRTSESQLFEFRNKYPKAVPRDTPLPNGLKKSLARASSNAGKLANVNAEIQRVESKLQQDVSGKKKKLERSRKYADDADLKRKQLGSARAGGLGEQHPTIKRLQAEYDSLKALERQAQREGTSALERETDAARIALNEQLRVLRNRRRALQVQRSRTDRDKSQAAIEQESLPALQARYQELSRSYSSSEADYKELTAKLRNKTLDLENARAHGENHYDITTPPTGTKPSIIKATVKRAVLGGFVGLFLALLAAGILELRARLLARRIS